MAEKMQISDFLVNKYKPAIIFVDSCEKNVSVFFFLTRTVGQQQTYILLINLLST